MTDKISEAEVEARKIAGMNKFEKAIREKTYKVLTPGEFVYLVGLIHAAKEAENDRSAARVRHEQAAVPEMTEEALARRLAELRHDEVFGVPLDEKAKLSRLYWVESQWRGFKHAAAFIIDRLANAQPDNRVAELEATIDDAASGIAELRRQLREAKASLAEARKVIEPFAAADRAIGNEPGPFRFETTTGHRLIEREHLAAARDWLARNKEP